jgi:hypothetical protein
VKRIRPVRAVALLLAAALAACSDVPTGAATAESGTVALNTYPAPVPSVSNSGGQPLVSWSALSGATSYDVTLAISWTYSNRGTGAYDSGVDTVHVGSTTGTSLLHAVAYTGVSYCNTSYGYESYRETWRYRVTAHFADGTSTATVLAPIADC